MHLTGSPRRCVLSRSCEQASWLAGSLDTAWLGSTACVSVLSPASCSKMHAWNTLQPAHHRQQCICGIWVIDVHTCSCECTQLTQNLSSSLAGTSGPRQQAAGHSQAGTAEAMRLQAKVLAEAAALASGCAAPCALEQWRLDPEMRNTTAFDEVCTGCRGPSQCQQSHDPRSSACRCRWRPGQR